MTVKEKFLDLLKRYVNSHSIYLWGAQGEQVKKLNYETVRKMETSAANAQRVIRRIELLKEMKWISGKTRAFDCSGLLCYCLYHSGREPEIDITADSLFARYPHTTQLTEGCLLHRSGHIAAYIGLNYLIEAKGRDYGVVISPYYPKEWDSEFANPFAA